MWTTDKRQAQTLAEKLENLLPNLIQVSKKEFRERFKKPERDKATGLYVVANESQNKDKPMFCSKS